MKNCKKDKVVDCPICGKKQPYYYLQQHLKIHTKPHKCSLCSYRASCFTLLKTHFSHVHKSEYKFSCSLCTRKFVRKRNLKRHLPHCKMVSYNCNECSFTAASMFVLRKHTKSHKYVICSLCLFKVHKERLNHSHCQTSECPSCSMLFRCKGLLMKHMITHKENSVLKPKKFDCNICPDESLMINSYKVRYSYVHKEVKVSDIISCTCGFNFCNVLSYSYHRKFIHKDPEPFTCVKCAHVSDRADRFIEHLKKHSGEEIFVEKEEECFDDDKVTCNICPLEKDFSSHAYHRKFINLYVRHKDVPDSDIIACQSCNFSYCNVYTYSFHKKYIHKDPVPFSCQECDVAFGQVSLLKRHLVVHEKPQRARNTFRSNAKKYCNSSEAGYEVVKASCNICPLEDASDNAAFKKFTVKPVTHQIVQDSDIITCDFCNFQFCNILSYSYHKKYIHDIIQPFACDKCNYSSSRLNAFTKHLEMHSKLSGFMVESNSCCICPNEINKLNTFSYKWFSKYTNVHRIVGPKGILHCSQCSADFCNILSYSCHKLYVHQDPKPYACNQCNFVADKMSVLMNHVDKHPDPDTGIFTCHLCPFKSKIRNLMRKHKLGHKELKFCKRYCLICNRQFESREAYFDHKRLYHKASFTCDFCSYSSYKKSHLKRHLSICYEKKLSFGCPTGRRRDFNTRHKLSADKQNVDNCIIIEIYENDDLMFSEHIL